jgi:protease secretion system outer membrane protein
MGVLVVATANSGELSEGFGNALSADPTYQSARAELESNQIGARQAGRAYWPELGLKYGDRSESGGAQRTVQITQPIISAERLATWLGSDALASRAEATMRQREAELAGRYFSTVVELVRAREGLGLSQRKIEAMELQVAAAKRGFELGTGTLTDQRDAAVRLQQSRAEEIGLKARMAAAERQFQAITGQPLKSHAFALPRKKRSLALPDVNQLRELLLQNNPALTSARQNERLADLEIWRKRGMFLPQVGWVTKETTIDNVGSARYVGITVDLPLQSSGMLGIDAAKANGRKAAEDLRAVEQRLILELERLHALVEAGQMESEIRLEAIEAAKLSLEGNQQSFKGGIRSQLDVINSIQMLFQVQDEYVAALLSMATNLVSLHSQIGAKPVVDILTLLDEFLF